MVSVAVETTTQAVLAELVKATERVGDGLEGVASKVCGKYLPLITTLSPPRMLSSATGVAEVAVHVMVVGARVALLMAPCLVLKTGT